MRAQRIAELVELVELVNKRREEFESAVVIGTKLPEDARVIYGRVALSLYPEVTHLSREEVVNTYDHMIFWLKVSASCCMVAA